MVNILIFPFSRRVGEIRRVSDAASKAFGISARKGASYLEGELRRIDEKLQALGVPQADIERHKEEFGRATVAHKANEVRRDVRG